MTAHKQYMNINMYFHLDCIFLFHPNTDNGHVDINTYLRTTTCIQHSTFLYM